jgi:hypothetical protein
MHKNRFTICLLHLVAGLILPLSVSAGPGPAKFGPQWQPLLGEWKGEDAAGAKSGACGFHLSPADHVIVRTNHAVLAGAAPHDDLMIIYPGATEEKGRAVYFDNEGHVIEYDADWSADGNTLTLISKPAAGPRFRLIYKKTDATSFSVNFEMAPPGQASFKTYTSGKLKR